jgi:hypothetical protein
MKEYKIEGNIDFYAELYKSLDNEEDKIMDDSNLCLITNQPLVDKYVKLNCGHKFNYIPLYNDFVNHKSKFNYLEGNSGLLKGNENRCPYCRNKQNELLPYYEDLGLTKVPGVNTETKHKYEANYYNHTCEYLTPNLNFDPSGNNPTETDYYQSNCKFFKCKNYGYQLQSKYEDKKYYCYKHKNIVIQKYKKEAQDKLKEDKLKAKENAKKEKEEAKQKAKEEKQKAKEELKKMVMEEKMKNKNKTTKKLKQIMNEVTENIEEENVVIGFINVSEPTNACNETLKTGPNKGKQCGASVYKECLCKRHYNLKNK